MQLVVSQQAAEALHHLYRANTVILGQRGIPNTAKPTAERQPDQRGLPRELSPCTTAA